MVFMDFGLALGNEALESWRLKSTKSISSDGFWLDEDRELELLNEEELGMRNKWFGKMWIRDLN